MLCYSTPGSQSFATVRGIHGVSGKATAPLAMLYVQDADDADAPWDFATTGQHTALSGDGKP